MRHATLLAVIGEIHHVSRRTYGARQTRAELTRGQGIAITRWGVELLMRREGLAGLPGLPRYGTDQS